MPKDCGAIPADRQGLSANVFLSFEVEDAAAVFTAFTDAGVSIAHDLRGEPQGQRHFIARDPDGILVDAITPIAPSAEFLALYADGAPPNNAPPAASALTSPPRFANLRRNAALQGIHV